MTARSVLVALGVGLTTAVLVAVVVIETLDFEFSAIVGLPVGLVVGVGIAVLVELRYGHAGSPVRVLADGTAGFGYAIMVMLAIKYVNVADLESVLTLVTLVIVALAVAGAVGVVSWFRTRSSY